MRSLDGWQGGTVASENMEHLRSAIDQRQARPGEDDGNTGHDYYGLDKTSWRNETQDSDDSDGGVRSMSSDCDLRVMLKLEAESQQVALFETQLWNSAVSGAHSGVVSPFPYGL